MSIESVINFHRFFELLPLVYQSIIAAVILGILAGVIGPMIQARDMAFAVHGTSEISFAGASFALWMGASVTWGAIGGSIIGGMILSIMGMDKKNRNMVIGVLLPFGLGLGILFLSLYQGRSSNKFGLLAGQIVAVNNNDIKLLLAIALIVIGTMFIFGKRMFYTALDGESAQSKGIRTFPLTLIFMMILSLVVAMSVQLVGALLVLSLLITPTAAASRVTNSPAMIHLLSAIFATVSAVGGILLSLGPGLPISPYVTTVSFLLYIICWLISYLKKTG